MKRSKTSKAWMHEHVTDPYVHRAKAEGYRSRAAFKLLEIDVKDRLLRPGLVVVDLGAAPGSWAQVAAGRLGPAGRLIALDMLEIEPLPGVEFIQGDFREEAVLAQLERVLGGRPLDLVLSDMAPNWSGIAVSDQARSMHLAELTLDFAALHLKPGGDLLVKVFQGAGFQELRQAMQRVFGSVVVRKPQASRGRSAELYLLGRGRRASVAGPPQDGCSPPWGVAAQRRGHMNG
jgi:23S rRNA (uridine2552-2'-O)-methyltransferase